jgi:uncharacterized iron-regulated membrane protein
MNENSNEHRQHRPYWTRIHHSVGFWIFLFLMLIGILYYIITVDFAFAPKLKNITPAGKQITL